MKGKNRQISLLLWVSAIVPAALLICITGEAIEAAAGPYYSRIIELSGIAIIAAVSLNIVNGFTGQFSIGHAGFMLVGAYTSASVTVFCHSGISSAIQAAHIPQKAQSPIEFAIAMMAGAVAASAAGLLVGLPSLRLKGDYLAIATLGFGEGIRAIFFTVEAVGGASGMHNIPLYTGFTWIFLGAAGVIIVSRNLALSSHGRALFAIREDELAAQSVGINTFKYKVVAFVLAAAWAGIAGSLLAHHEQGIVPKDYGFVKSIEIIVIVVLGGMGSITGSVIAAVILTWLPELLRPIADYRMAFYSLLLILLMLLRPTGLLGRKEFGRGLFSFGKSLRKEGRR